MCGINVSASSAEGNMAQEPTRFNPGDKVSLVNTMPPILDEVVSVRRTKEENLYYFLKCNGRVTAREIVSIDIVVGSKNVA